MDTRLLLVFLIAGGVGRPAEAADVDPQKHFSSPTKIVELVSGSVIGMGTEQDQGKWLAAINASLESARRATLSLIGFVITNPKGIDRPDEQGDGSATPAVYRFDVGPWMHEY